MRFFTSDLSRNIIKILCLTVGLAIGFILVAKITVEETYDSFYPAADRTYLVTEAIEQNGDYRAYDHTAGGIGPALLRYVPQVEAATRFTGLHYGGAIALEGDGRTFAVEGVTLADSCLFDVLPRDIIAGNAAEALAVKGFVAIPRSLAEKIGGDVIGRRFTHPELSDDYVMTVGAVYDDFPVNSTVRNMVFLCLANIGDFSFDGRENLLGNDRYNTYVRLAEGSTPAEVEPHARRMLIENVDKEFVERFKYALPLRLITDHHFANDSTRTMVWVLVVLSVVVLLSAALNYLLVVIGQMSRRAREMAVRKCYGTSNAAIFGRIMGESVFFLVVSMALAVLLLLSFGPLCEQLMGFTSQQLLTTSGVWAVELLVCLVLLVITGVIPAWMYCRTPVAHAFRPSVRSRRSWKLVMLAVQFFASGLIVCLLTLVVRQYRMMAGGDMGFDTDNIAFVYLGGLEQDVRRGVVDELRRLPEVENVASSYHFFIEHASGNNVWTREDNIDSQVNVADMYGANPEVLETLGFRLVEGSNFSEHADSTRHEVIVENRFRDVLAKLGDDSGELLGKTFFISEHWDPRTQSSIEFTIVGVIEPIRRGGYVADNADLRAGVYFPSQRIRENLYIRLHDLTPESLRAVQEAVNRRINGREIYVTTLASHVEAVNAPVRNFGLSVTIAGVAILIITVIGLVGYTADEVNRRAREIAIRKVNGTGTGAILRLLCRGIAVVALPSLAAGGVVAAIVGTEWLTQFTDRVTLGLGIMALSLMVLLLLIVTVVALNSLRIARSNPVEFLRSE